MFSKLANLKELSSSLITLYWLDVLKPDITDPPAAKLYSIVSPLTNPWLLKVILFLIVDIPDCFTINLRLV